MITENRPALSTTSLLRPQSRVRLLLPWLLAAGAFVLYALTLNRWLTLNSLSQVARLSGWSWQPEIWPFALPQPGPLYWLLTYPLRWLPSSSIPFALSLLSAVLGSLVLALLARSVMLLPHNRTQAQRLREKSPFALLSIRAALLPPVLAVLVCGLQLTFWEYSTGASQEMLNLLLFAYVIRALLEFRIDGHQTWLSRAALVYGVGIANDWAFIAFFPIFIAAIIALKRLGFFELRFLGRMCLLGLAGMLFYFLLPIVQSFSDTTPVPFWTALRANLGGQKLLLGTAFNKEMLLHGDRPLWVLGLASLLPLLAMSIKWPSYFGDTSRLGTAIASFGFHLVHAILLMLCIWIAFGPAMSPRYYVPEGLRSFLPMLTLYYLGALAVGYISGYFLLILVRKGDRLRRVGAGGSEGLLSGTAAVLTLAVGFLLVARNLPLVRAGNGTALKQFAELLAVNLPKEPAIILSDDLQKLLLARAFTAPKDQGGNLLFVETGSLKWPDYQRYLKRKFPHRWLQQPQLDLAKRQQAFDDGTVLRSVLTLAQSNSVYYLHPSFGYYFEYFLAEPHGLVYKLTFYPPATLLPPPLTPALLAENEAFWDSAGAKLQFHRPASSMSQSRTNQSWLDRLFRRAHLVNEPEPDLELVAADCSRALNYWGVEAQKHGQLQQAGTHFKKALELNPENLVAQVNLDCNKSLQAGRPTTIHLSKSIEDQFGKYRKWDQVFNANGPFDQPDFCLENGRFLTRAGFYHQAADQFNRAAALMPDNIPARLMLAQLYLVAQMPDRALELMDQIHALPPEISLNRTNQNDLLYLEMSFHLAKNDLPGALSVFERVNSRFPGDEELMGTATRVFMNTGRYTNAIAIIDQQLQLAPKNASALVNKAYALMQLHDYAEAVEHLNQALALEPSHPNALFDRAICCLQMGKLDDAQQSYEQLQKLYPTEHRIYFGLAEIALRKGDTNSAIRNYELYLTNSPAGNEEASLVRTRLTELKPTSR